MAQLSEHPSVKHFYQEKANRGEVPKILPARSAEGLPPSDTHSNLARSPLHITRPPSLLVQASPGVLLPVAPCEPSSSVSQMPHPQTSGTPESPGLC